MKCLVRIGLFGLCCALGCSHQGAALEQGQRNAETLDGLVNIVNNLQEQMSSQQSGLLNFSYVSGGGGAVAGMIVTAAIVLILKRCRRRRNGTDNTG